ncbi:hypothetical protein D9M71_504150 [compost metagenome]
MALQGAADQGAALVPDRRAGRGEGLFQGRALAVLLGQAGQQAQLPGQGPEDHGGLHTFSAQAFQGAQGMGGFAVERGIDQAEDVESGAVGDRRLDGGGIHLAAFGQQLEFLDLLGGCQQVAFDPGGDQVHRFLVGRETHLGQALANPLGQVVGLDGPDLDELDSRPVDQRLGPFGLLRAAVELGQAQQQDGVFRRPRQVLEQGCGTLVARLAGGHAHFQQALLGEQREAGTGFQQQAPVEVGLGVEHLALAEVPRTGAGANGVAGFLAEQRFVAADHVDRCQLALQVFTQLCGVEFHRRK